MHKMLHFISDLIRPFVVRREERWGAWGALCYVAILNIMMISAYADRFMTPVSDYRRLFVRTFHVSGFDPLTYSVVSDWGTDYNIYRHPLLAFFMYIPAQVNRLLMAMTGQNMVQIVVGAMLTFSAFYAFVFFCRTLHDIVRLSWRDSWLLGALCFSFAYVMIAACVPDHFIFSMMMLCLVLYLVGTSMQRGRPLKTWQTVTLFFLTAGISLNNGIKVLLADWFDRGRKFWHPRHLVFAVVLPCALIWGMARAEWYVYERPSFVARQQKKAHNDSIRYAKIARTFRDTTSLRDTAAIRAGIDRAMAAWKQQRLDKKVWHKHTGKPLARGEFSQWTDITTPRWASVVENLFGESIQLHRDHLLEDSLTTRPVIVRYRLPINYVVEALLVLLFLAGVWCGRRQRLLWLALSWMAFDLLIHVGLGFALNEVYIVAAHWVFVPVLVMGFLLKSTERGRLRTPLRLTVLTLTLFLMGWNLMLLASYIA
jgi:hypothetical protein